MFAFFRNFWKNYSRGDGFGMVAEDFSLLYWRFWVCFPGNFMAGAKPWQHVSCRGQQLFAPGMAGEAAAAPVDSWDPGGRGDHRRGAGGGDAMEPAASCMGLSAAALESVGTDLSALFPPVAAPGIGGYGSVSAG